VTQKEELKTSMLGALLKQALGRLERMLEEIATFYKDEKIVIRKWR